MGAPDVGHPQRHVPDVAGLHLSARRSLGGRCGLDGVDDDPAMPEGVAHHGVAPVGCVGGGPLHRGARPRRPGRSHGVDVGHLDHEAHRGGRRRRPVRRRGCSGDSSARNSGAAPSSSSACPTRPSAMTIGSPRRRAPSTSTYQSIARRASATMRYGVTSRAAAVARVTSGGQGGLVTIDSFGQGQGALDAGAQAGGECRIGLDGVGRGAQRLEGIRHRSPPLLRRRGGRRARARTSRPSVACTLRSTRSATSGTEQVVEVAQGQHGAVQRRQLGQGGRGPAARRARRPSCRRASPLGGGPRLCRPRAAPLLAGLATPVVDELVAGHPDEPRHRHRGPVSSRRTASTAASSVSAVRSSARATPPQRDSEVAVDVGERPVVQRSSSGVGPVAGPVAGRARSHPYCRSCDPFSDG